MAMDRLKDEGRRKSYTFEEDIVTCSDSRVEVGRPR